MRILNSSLIIEEHFSNWSKNTQKRSKQRKNQHFCSETTGVIKNIMRKNWVTHKKHGETPKMGLKNKNGSKEKTACHIVLLCGCQSNTRVSVQISRENVKQILKNRETFPKMYAKYPKLAHSRKGHVLLALSSALTILKDHSEKSWTVKCFSKKETE